MSFRALHTLISELIHGAQGPGCWVINNEDPGLLAYLQAVTAQQASQPPCGAGEKSIAAHANHLLYSLTLVTRWVQGEENPFTTADWAGSWQHGSVTEEQWQETLAQLQHHSTIWLAAIETQAASDQPWDEFATTGAFATASHIAYHFGAIKQIRLGLEG